MLNTIFQKRITTMINIFKKNMNNLKFTKLEKKILDYFLENERKIVFLNAKEIGEKLNTSDTSIIRFIKKLGYQNFGSFKTNLKKQLESDILTPTEKLKSNNELLKNSNLNNLFFKNIDLGLSSTFNSDSIKTLEKITTLVCKSRKKFVIGFKSTSGIVSFFGLRLGYLMENVETFFSDSSELIKRIVDINSEDVLIIFAYAKYSKTYDILIEIAKEAGAKIIIFTDKKSSPYVFLGDEIFVSDVTGTSFFSSMIVTQAVCEYLLTNISSNKKGDYETRIEKINYYLTKKLK